MSAARWAVVSGTTLKPSTMAFEVAANITSPSLILPVPERMILTPISSVLNSFTDEMIGSREPCTSALIIRFKDFDFYLLD